MLAGKQFFIVSLSLIIISVTGIVEAYYGGRQSSISTVPESYGLIIKFKPGGQPQEITQKNGVAVTSNPVLNAINNKYSVESMTALESIAPKRGENHPLSGIFLVESADKSSPSEMRADYEKLDEVLWVEPDYLVAFHSVPDDEYFPHLWNLYNHGQGHYDIERGNLDGDDKLIIRYGLDDADIDFDNVPSMSPDATHQTVAAIIDTGLDLFHPDLEGRIWINAREIAGNGKDDDHNGYIDDVCGWDYSASGGSPKPEDNDPSDNLGHGTHIAGTIAAVSGNGIGITGIAPQCKIMPLKINPWALTSKIARAIIYAADNGADVINMSFGLPYRSLIIESALEYAYNKGVVLCASSGNSGVAEVNYPAGSPLTMAVGATNDSDRVTVFSSYGDHVDLCAPGEAILSLRAEGTDMYNIPPSAEPGVHIIGNQYYISSGTSMSCPHVVATAAYLKSKSPGLSPDRVRAILNGTADDITDPFGRGEDLVGFDIYSGHGRLNLEAALENTPAVVAQITYPGAHQIINGIVEITGSAYGDDFFDYRISFGAGYIPDQWTIIIDSDESVKDDILGFWNTNGLASGIYTLKLNVGADNVAYRIVHVIGENICVIESPLDNATVPQIIDIRGSVYGPEFDRAILEYGVGAEPPQWYPLAEITAPVFHDIMAAWYIKIDNGNLFSLRLTSFTTTGLEVADTVKVTVESILNTSDAWKVHLPGLPSAIANYGDYDGDGINEIVIGTDAGIVFISPDGAIKSSGMPTFPINKYFVPVAVGDGNGDGVDDIAALGNNPPTLHFSSGAGPTFDFSIPDTISAGGPLISEGTISKVFFRDINGDGADEIHLFLYNGSHSNVYVFNASGAVLANISRISEYLSCDLNGDRVDELYYYRSGSGKLSRATLGGQIQDSVILIENGARLACHGLSAYDVDGDGLHELILNGSFDGGRHKIYAFDYDLQILDGWPHDMELDDYLTPTVPIFADIDGDDVPEYFTSYFDYSESFVFAWRLDGTSIITEGTDGHFIKVPHPAILNMLLAADLDGDHRPDLVARANNDLFSSFKVQRLYAWNNVAESIERFPIVLNEKEFVTPRYTPTIGDINKDGYIDLVVPADDSSLIFINFTGSEYNEENCPVPVWRYSRRFNNVGPAGGSGIITDVEETEGLYPAEFSLAQNAPNPFNPATAINYTITRKAHVRLEIFDILGRHVRTMVDGIQGAGSYSVLFDGRADAGNKLASGVYFYRLRVDDQSQIKTMVLLK